MTTENQQTARRELPKSVADALAKYANAYGRNLMAGSYEREVDEAEQALSEAVAGELDQLRTYLAGEKRSSEEGWRRWRESEAACRAKDEEIAALWKQIADRDAGTDQLRSDAREQIAKHRQEIQMLRKALRTANRVVENHVSASRAIASKFDAKDAEIAKLRATLDLVDAYSVKLKASKDEEESSVFASVGAELDALLRTPEQINGAIAEQLRAFGATP